jgi:ankyrin repeat protein
MDELFEVLVRAGACVMAGDRFGNTPLHHLACVREFNATLVKILVDAGAKIDCVHVTDATDVRGRTGARGICKIHSLPVESWCAC